MEESGVDSELKIKMANLEIMQMEDANTGAEADTDDYEPPIGAGPRVLRQRKQVPYKSTKSRVTMKPRRFYNTLEENGNQKQIEAIYLNKKVKNVSQSLETIHEEPLSDGKETAIGGRKVKRLLTLTHLYTKDKIKKRRSKIKRLLGNKSFLNRKKIPMKVFLETIERLEVDLGVSTSKEIIPPIADKVLM